MKLSKYLYLLPAAVLMLFGASSCQPDGIGEAMAVMTSTSSLTFDAADAAEVTITVYADGDWTVEAPDWAIVDPMSGTGCMDVTITVTDNLLDGTPDNPRKGHIYFTGCNLDIRGDITVYQKGDKYRGINPVTLAEVVAMENESVVLLESATVAAVTAKGVIVSDGTNNIYVDSKPEGVQIGSKISLSGEKGADAGLPAIVNIETISVIGTETPVYPAEKDITADVDNYSATTREFITVTGMLNGSKVEVDGAVFAVNCKDVDSSLGLSEMDGHKVTVKGFFAGLAKPVINVHVATVEDLGGGSSVVIFSDDFEWLADLSAATSAGDAVTDDNPSTTAPNIYNISDEVTSLWVEEFTNKRGYNYLWAKTGDTEYHDISSSNPKVLYIQKNYLKFGKTDYNAALVLPALSKVQGTQDLTIEFDWCWQVTGAYKPDLMTLSVHAANGGTFANSGDAVSAPLESAQSTTDGESHIAWQHVSIVLNGATASTVLTIRPTNVDPRTSNPDRGQNRWYLDNIKIVAEGGAGGGADEPDENPGKLCCKWLFSENTISECAATFSSPAGSEGAKAEGDAGQYVPNNFPGDTNVGTGAIYYYNVDKTSLDINDKVSRVIGGTGHPYVTGAWPGDYWLFTATNGKKFAAGTQVHIYFITRISATGQKYWMLEAWDGEKWIPAAEVKTATVNGAEVKYNFEPTKETTNSTVDFTWTLAATCKLMKFRYTCCADCNFSGSPLNNPNGGTNRIAGAPASDDGTTACTSPVFEVL